MENKPLLPQTPLATPSTRRSPRAQALLQTALVLAIIFALNLLATRFYHRFDLTKEKRFTLTSATQKMLSNLDDVVYVRVFLEGDLPPGFRRLRNATQDMLDEFRSYAPIEYEFIDPTADNDTALITDILKAGLKPTPLIQQKQGYSEQYIYPGALVTYKGRTLATDLLQQQLNRGPQETLNNSIGLLEFNLANAINKIQQNDRPKIAFLRGQGELPNQYVQDIGNDISRFYVLDTFDLNKNDFIPKTYQAIIIAKPTQPFSELNKFKLDQYVMNGGRILWLVENVQANIDSLQRGSLVATNYELNLEDLLFKYGVKLNFDLVEDVQSVTVPFMADATKMVQLPWPYYPLVSNHNNEHVVSKNLDAVLLRFAGTIDTTTKLKNPIKRTPLLKTTPYTRIKTAPIEINAEESRQKPNPADFNGGEQTVAMALEGSFPSLFKNRLDASTQQIIDNNPNLTRREESLPTKMIIVADGDVIANDLDRRNNRNLPLGFYRYTNQTFANKEFLINAVEWLTDDYGIVEARNKEIKLRLLDTQRIEVERTFWQFVNLVLPVLLVLVFGVAYYFWRRKKYAL